MPDLYGPIVNLNGATRESLLKQHADVMKAAADLYRAMCTAAPHGRDYQTAAAGAYSNDDAVFREMLLRVDQIERTYRRVAERLATEEGR